jgi:hypothetical protein
LLGRRRRLDVVFAETQVRIRHAGSDFANRVADARDAWDFFAVEARGKEAIFFDRTHLVLSRAAEVGEVLDNRAARADGPWGD